MLLDEATVPGLLSISVWTFERLSHLLTWRTCPGPGQGQEGRGGDTTVAEATGPSADQRVWPSHTGSHSRQTAMASQTRPWAVASWSPRSHLQPENTARPSCGAPRTRRKPQTIMRQSWEPRTVTAIPTQSCDRCRKMSFYRITANLVLFFLVIYSNWENSGKNKQRK